MWRGVGVNKSYAHEEYRIADLTITSRANELAQEAIELRGRGREPVSDRRLAHLVRVRVRVRARCRCG